MLRKKIFAINLIFTFSLIEILCFLFFKIETRFFYLNYWSNKTNLETYYPNYFEKNIYQGFDIKRNSNQILFNKPSEIKNYPIWGNNIGCFDENISNQNKYQIYLAGDSMTWGFAPIEKKFGTLLEKEINKNIAACGVSHTGQIHQFQKFKKITTQIGYYPEIVIVNVFANDIDNDFSHPHSTVMNGFLVNNKKVINKDGDPLSIKLNQEALLRKIDKRLKKSSISFDPRRFSAIAVFTGKFLSNIKNYIQKDNISLCNSLDIYGVTNCFSEVGTFSYPINEIFAERNRNIIIEWINHSKINNYVLIFADMRTQFQSIRNFEASKNLKSVSEDQEFCDFINTQKGYCRSFIKYLVKANINNWYDLIWKYDGHFNFYGNKIYSNFLKNSIQNFY